MILIRNLRRKVAGISSCLFKEENAIKAVHIIIRQENPIFVYFLPSNFTSITKGIKSIATPSTPTFMNPKR